MEKAPVLNVVNCLNITIAVYNIPRTWLLNRVPVSAIDLKSIVQACDVTS